jgi:hypothetical protein
VPETEARRRTARVRPVRRAAPQAGVHPERDVAARERAPEAVELVERAGVVEDAAADELFEAARRHLRRQLDACGLEARAERALDLGVAGRVDVQAELAEHAQDGAARVRLHRVAEREAEGVREGERGARGGLERRAIVDVAGCAEPLTDGRRVGSCQEHRGQRIIRRRRNATARRPRPWAKRG